MYLYYMAMRCILAALCNVFITCVYYLRHPTVQNDQVARLVAAVGGTQAVSLYLSVARAAAACCDVIRCCTICCSNN
jgi:hypothetical protein